MHQVRFSSVIWLIEHLHTSQLLRISPLLSKVLTIL
jgi:hypothetical protein